MFNSFSFAALGLIPIIISLIIIITFFVMAFRLRKIQEALEKLVKLEYSKPESQRIIKCDKCGKEFNVSIVKDGLLTDCPECKNPVRS